MRGAKQRLRKAKTRIGPGVRAISDLSLPASFVIRHPPLFPPSEMPPRLAYLFSRYPIVSQTFCDTEMLALERAGVELELYSIYPPPTSFRHGHAARMKAPIHTRRPRPILKLGEAAAKRSGRWPAELVAEHERRYRPGLQGRAARAQCALFRRPLQGARDHAFPRPLRESRGAHRAFRQGDLAAFRSPSPRTGRTSWSISATTICCARFAARRSSSRTRRSSPKAWSPSFARTPTGKCSASSTAWTSPTFPPRHRGTANPVPRIVSIGRLIEFKGFHHLIAACAKLKRARARISSATSSAKVRGASSSRRRSMNRDLGDQRASARLAAAGGSLRDAARLRHFHARLHRRIETARATFFRP